MPQPTTPQPSRRQVRARTARDRRDRGVRGPLAWPRVPTMRSPAAVFDVAALTAWQAIEERHGSSLAEIELAVETVPPSDPTPWESRVALGRVFPADAALPARVVLYRRPIETRAAVDRDLGPDSLTVTVHQVLAEQIGSLLDVDPDDLI